MSYKSQWKYSICYGFFFNSHEKGPCLIFNINLARHANSGENKLVVIFPWRNQVNNSYHIRHLFIQDAILLTREIGIRLFCTLQLWTFSDLFRSYGNVSFPFRKWWWILMRQILSNECNTDQEPYINCNKIFVTVFRGKKKNFKPLDIHQRISNSCENFAIRKLPWK